MFINVPATFTITGDPLGDHPTIAALLDQDFRPAPHQTWLSSSQCPRRIAASRRFVSR
jgi:hypothetical protein